MSKVARIGDILNGCEVEREGGLTLMLIGDGRRVYKSRCQHWADDFSEPESEEADQPMGGRIQSP